MKLKSALLSLFAARLRQLAWTFFLLVWAAGVCEGQQIQWAKVYPLRKPDAIYCMAKDQFGDIYAGGHTERNIPGSPWTVYHTGFLMKLTPTGDTLFTKEVGYGSIFSMVVDYEGNIRINLFSESINPYYDKLLILLKMTSDGFIFQRDTIQPVPNGMYPLASIISNDNSLIVVGQTPRLGAPSQLSMFFQRVQSDGTIDSWIELNPGHPNCVANRVEQLPNGHYLVSGYVGSRIASFELNEDGSNPEFKQWYQTPDFSNLNGGYVSQAVGKKNVIAGQGSPCRIGLYDSLQQKIWMKSDTGILIAPQAMTDGSLMFGYSYRPQSPTKYFQRMAADSSTIWKMSFGDSLIDRGYPGSVKMNAFTSFPDGSAVLAGIYRWDGAGTTNTKEDPFFLRIANVGTPVTSLTKPKRGTLSNETLAPWPNPSGGTLYLKQHFDKAEVHFYTVSGREVQTDTVRFGQPINISSFAPGLYLYRAVIDGKPFSGKVVRQ
jgi:hypothetical protein